MAIQLETDLSTFTVDGPSGCTVTELAELAGLTLNTRCAGLGVCGGCAIKLGLGRYEIDGESFEIYPNGYRTALACQVSVLSETAVITIPATTILEQDAQIEGEIVISTEFNTGLMAVCRIEIPTQDYPAGSRDVQKWLKRTLKQNHQIELSPPPLSVWASVSGLFAERPSTFSVLLAHHLDTWHLLALEPAEKQTSALGIAVDIGTTTVAAWGVNLETGEALTHASMYNQQIRKADDVGSRISYGSSPERVRILQRLLLDETLLPLIHELCDNLAQPVSSVKQISFSGNTVMTHLCMGISPASIGQLPFTPVLSEFPALRGIDLDLKDFPTSLITTTPAISGFVGGDLSSGIYQSRIHSTDDVELLIDIGTNGEIILNACGQLLACATAAGPAFEGYGLTHGCRASTGAIERVKITSDLKIDIEVIGNIPPTGICGSGIIDFIAQGFSSGLINSMGRYDRDMANAAGRLETNSTLCGDSVGFILARTEETGRKSPLFVTEQDIAQVLKAKAAISAGIQTLLQTQDLESSDLKRIHLAGGFAKHIHVRNAIILGLLPDVEEGIFTLIGNTSLSGAHSLMTRDGAAAEMKSIAQSPTVIELNLEPDFEGSFIDALAIPNMNEALFPSVQI